MARVREMEQLVQTRGKYFIHMLINLKIGACGLMEYIFGRNLIIFQKPVVVRL